MNPPAETTFREIAHGSDAYRQECALRQEVLRRPLGLNLYDEDLNAEAAQRHYGLFDGDALRACIVAVPMPAHAVKLRQMAVSPEMQGRGLGRKLMEQVEAELVRHGWVSATLHARATAVGFYAKLGYQVVGGEFIEVSLRHFKMEKHLAGQPV